MTYDILIKKGKIIDGTGNPWYKSDVAIEGGGDKNRCFHGVSSCLI